MHRELFAERQRALTDPPGRVVPGDPVPPVAMEYDVASRRILISRLPRPGILVCIGVQQNPVVVPAGDRHRNFLDGLFQLLA